MIGVQYHMLCAWLHLVSRFHVILGMFVQVLASASSDRTYTHTHTYIYTYVHKIMHIIIILLLLYCMHCTALTEYIRPPVQMRAVRWWCGLWTDRKSRTTERECKSRLRRFWTFVGKVLGLLVCERSKRERERESGLCECVMCQCVCMCVCVVHCVKSNAIFLLHVQVQ